MDAPQGKTQLYFDFRVDMKEMATWSPERIKQFFDGIAKMVEAAGKRALKNHSLLSTGKGNYRK